MEKRKKVVGVIQSRAKHGEPIEYIRKDIPAFDVPKYRGKSYEALVPDTLDLQERATLAINGLTGPTDPKADYALYFFAFFLHNPPMMWHDISAPCITKFWESLPLMRIMSGSNLNMPVEKRWMEVMLRMLGPDGLPYFPLKGQPWLRINVPHHILGIPSTDDPIEHFTLPLFCGRQIGAMTLYYLLTGDETWKGAGQEMVHGLTELAIDKGDYAYFPEGNFSPGVPRVRDAKMPTSMASTFVGWTIQGLVQYYRATGYEPALALSGKLAKYIKDYGGYYDAEARFLPYVDELGRSFTHFHHHTLPLLGMLEYAIAADDREMVEYVRKGYEYGKANGNVVVGYFPEYIGLPGYSYSEICEVADMIALGLKLTQAGAGDYWDDVDRWVRNQLIEGQLLHVDWVYRNAELLPVSPVDQSYQTADRVPERNIGAFAGWPSANDWFGGLEDHPFTTLPQIIHPVIQHCCTGNGTRALYYVWENILHHTKGNLRINLLLNRTSPWADVDSHIPYTGQVDVKVKETLELEIRIPEWVKPEEVQVTVNGSKRRCAVKGRYLQTGTVKPSDAITVTFPIQERPDKIFIEKKQYQIVRKGNEVVCIDPPGRYCPLYQREHYRQDNTRWKRVTRFVSAESLNW